MRYEIQPDGFRYFRYDCPFSPNEDYVPPVFDGAPAEPPFAERRRLTP